MTAAAEKTAATGPATPEGKRIAARNATTHGLFARDVVLPHLGEDPEGYKALLAELTAQLRPNDLLEQHYVEKIAAASWRLRRLQRWQAQLFEDPALSEDEILTKLDRVMRHETTLHRQIDTSVKMLGREVAHLFESRARKEALYQRYVTERECASDEELDFQVMEIAWQKLRPHSLPSDFDQSRLDNAPKCQNEPAAVAAPDPSPVLGSGDGPSDSVSPTDCQNKPTASPSSPAGGGGSARRPGGVLPTAGVHPTAGVLPTGAGHFPEIKLCPARTLAR